MKFNIYKYTVYLVLIFLFFGVLFIMSCNKSDKVEEVKEQTSEIETHQRRKQNTGVGGTIGIKAVTIKPKSIDERITVGARILSKSIANITSDISGTITSIVVKEGQYIEKNAILLYIDASKAGRRFLPSPVLSAISGVVASLPVQLGNYIVTSTIIAVIDNPAQNKIYASVPEKYAFKMKVKQTAVLSLSEFENEKIDLIITEVNAKLSKKTQTLDIVLDFLPKDGTEIKNTVSRVLDIQLSDIASGTYGSIDILIKEHHNIITILRSMLVIRKNKQGVFVPGVFLVNKPQDFLSRVVFTPVTTGIEDNNTIEILSGIKENDVVISGGQNSIYGAQEVYVLNLDGRQREFPSEKSSKGKK